MPVIINGSTGISGTDGSAGTPAVQGTDGNTGMFFPAADTVAVASGGSERMRIASNGDVSIGPSATNRLNLSYNSISGEAAVGPNSTGGNTFLTLGTSLSGSYAERARINSGGQLFTTIDGTSSVMADYGCRAWVNFNGTGVIAIRGSGNVSSIGRNGTGDYTVNLATAMPDANYAVAVLAGDTGQTFGLPVQVSRAAGSYRFRTTNTSDTSQDSAFVNVVIFR